MTDVLVHAAVDVVPLWSVVGMPGNDTFELAGFLSPVHVSAFRPPSGTLADYRLIVERDAAQHVAASGPLPLWLAVQLVQHKLVASWLRDRAPHVAWDDALTYVEGLGERTYENDPVGCNLIISRDGTTGGTPVSAPQLQKILDPLAASPFSYLRVASDLGFVSYEQIGWNAVEDEETSELYPGFLRPLALAVDAEEFAVVRTPRGDIIVLDDVGVIATKRKGRWRIYDPVEFHYAIYEAVGGPFALARNLFEVALDLSFRRHGALLVYDSEGTVITQLANSDDCRLTPDHQGGDACRQMLSAALQPISLASSDAGSRKRRLLAEVSGMDGAVIFNNEQVLAVGAMIRPDVRATTEKGARSTAALSAFYHGGKPVKVSADGDVTIYYGPLDREPSRLRFL